MQLASLTTLQHFTAGSNQISGSLHPEFAAWRKLTFLHIGKLRGYQFKWLTADCSGNNSLSGSSSRGFGNWSAVQTLSIYGNPLVLLPMSPLLCASSPNVTTAVCLLPQCHHCCVPHPPLLNPLVLVAFRFLRACVTIHVCCRSGTCPQYRTGRNCQVCLHL